MIFACPNCNTAYDAPASSIGSGKKVRCSKCGHSWHQTPTSEKPIHNVSQGPTVNIPAQAPYPGYYPPPVYPHPAGQYPGVGAAPYPPPGYPPMPTPMHPEGSLPSNSTEKTGHDLDNGQSVKETTQAATANTPLPSQAELDSMFGSDDELAAMTTLPGANNNPPGNIRTSANMDQEINPDNIPEDVDPIPEVFTGGGNAAGSPEGEKGKKSRKGLVFVIILAVTIAALASSAIFFRDLVIEMVPMSKDIYSMVGLGPPLPGEGLIISNEKARRQSDGDGENAVEVLIVTGTITNVTNKDSKRASGKVVEGSGHIVKVPEIKVTLKDKKDKEVQSATVTPEKPQLNPGEKLRFKVEIKKPSSLARKIEAGFVIGASENN